MSPPDTGSLGGKNPILAFYPLGRPTFGEAMVEISETEGGREHTRRWWPSTHCLQPCCKGGTADKDSFTKSKA